MNKKKKSTNTSPYPDEASKEKQSVPTGKRPVVHIAIVCGSCQGASGRAHPAFSLLYIRCTKLRILMGETIPLYRAMTSHFLWASRTMPLHKQGRELRSEQPAPPYMSRVPLLVFLRLNNSKTFLELVGATPPHLANARPFCCLKVPPGLSLLRCTSQMRSHPKPCSYSHLCFQENHTGGIVSN